MSILDRIKNEVKESFLLDEKREEEIKHKDKVEILPWAEVPEKSGINLVSYDENAPEWNVGDYLKAAKSWTYACVSAIADEVAGTDIHLFKRKGDILDEVFEHPILDLLYKVNDFTTKFDHWWITQNHLEYVGEAFWFLGIEDGKPTSMYILRPDKVEIKYDKDTVIGHYIYEPEPGNKIKLEKEEVIFLKYPDPSRPLRGKGTLSAAKDVVDLDNYSEKWNVNFFYNQARPDAILTTDQKLTKEQRERLDKIWTKKFQGIDNHAKVAILESGLQYQQMQLSQKDMDFLHQQKFSRDKIFSIFRVPKSVIAISDDVNRANAEAGSYAFARWTIKPKLERIIEQLNEFLVPMFDEDLILKFDDPVPENTEMKIKKYESAVKSGWMTPNEIRDEESFPPVKGGDDLFLPNNLVPVGQPREKKEEKKLIKINRKNTVISEIEDKIKRIAKSHLKKQKNKIKKKVKKVEKAKKKGIVDYRDFWEKQISIEERYEKIIVSQLRYLFGKQEDEVLKRLENSSKNCIGISSKGMSQEVKFEKYWSEMKLSIPSILLNVKKETKKFAIVLSPIIRNLIDDEGEYVLDEMDVDVELDENSPNIDGYLEKHPVKFSTSVNKTTNLKIRKTLAEGVAEGESIDKLSKRIKVVFKEADRSRALNIARTEASRATNFATVEAYQQSGVVKGKKWLTAFDERTCERCSAMDGKVVELEDDYFKKGDSFMGVSMDYDNVGQPPLHNMCRCTVVPILK